MSDQLNFSPSPFKHRTKTLLILWTVNLSLLVGLGIALVSWNRLRHSNALAHEELDALNLEEQNLMQRHSLALSELAKVDLSDYRKKVVQFHEIQSAFATHWGKLLDDLGLLLPKDVRIISLRPQSSQRSRGRVKETVLRLSGQARSKEAQLSFIRALQAQPRFKDVHFSSETYGDNPAAAIDFEIAFTYLPGGGKS